MPLTDAQQLGQQKAIVECLIEIHGARSPPLSPVLPWLPLNGRVLKDSVYGTPHAEHGSWGSAVAVSLMAAVNAYRATQTGRATAAIKAESSLVEPLDALARRSDYDNPYDNPDALAALAESLSLGHLLVAMRATRGNAAGGRSSPAPQLPQRPMGGRAKESTAQPATGGGGVETDDGATTRAATAADARREELRAALMGLTVADVLKLGAGAGLELLATMLAGHATARGLLGLEHVLVVGSSRVTIRSVPPSWSPLVCV